METLKKIIAKQDELVEWLNSECPGMFPPLEPYTTADLSHGFCEGLRNRLDDIFYLKSRMSEEPDGAEEKAIAEFDLSDLFDDLEKNAYNAEFHNYHYREANLIIRKHFEKQVDFARQNLRYDKEDFLKDFAKWFLECGDITITDKHINDYLSPKDTNQKKG